MRSKGVLFIVVLVLGISLTLPSTSSAWSGWGWGPAAFLGGVLVGSVIARPYLCSSARLCLPVPCGCLRFPAATRSSLRLSQPAAYSAARGQGPMGRGTGPDRERPVGAAPQGMGA
jgi:hypothetical protein